MAETSFSWDGYVDPDQGDLSVRLDGLPVHPAAREDALEGGQPPKIEAFDQHLLITAWDIDPGAMGKPGEIVMLVGRGWLVTVQRGRDHPARDLRPIVRGDDEPSASTPLRAAYRILRAIVHDYVETARAIEDELDAVEAEVFDDSVLEDHERIYRLRRRIGRVDRAVSALTKAIDASPDDLRRHLDEDAAMRSYFQHMRNDLDGLSGLLDTQRLALDAVVSSHESNVSSRQNQDMRTIAAVAALLAIPTVIGGLYGMNFKDMPLLHTPLGWIPVLVFTAALDALAVFLFWKRGWLGSSTRRDK